MRMLHGNNSCIAFATIDGQREANAERILFICRGENWRDLAFR